MKFEDAYYLLGYYFYSCYGMKKYSTLVVMLLKIFSVHWEIYLGLHAMFVIAFLPECQRSNYFIMLLELLITFTVVDITQKIKGNFLS